MARPVGSRAAGLDGLSKLHKPNHSLRSVMYATRTVAYGLGKMLTESTNSRSKQSTRHRGFFRLFPIETNKQSKQIR
jgi:hypothetical protein